MLNLFEATGSFNKRFSAISEKYLLKTFDLKTQSVFISFNLYLFPISKIRYRYHSLFFHFLLLLSGDINPNPGPQNDQLNKMWEPFEKRGLHFIHININSLLPKIDEIRSIALKSNAALIGITESKLDDSVCRHAVSSPYT